MPRKIVYDIETKKAFNEVEGRKPGELGVSIVVAYDYNDETYKTFREEELKNLWPLFENAECIIGFNSKSFDNRVLSAYYPGDLQLLPHLDILEEFHKVAGFRVRLADIAAATLGESKLGSGLQAIQWYRDGDYASLEKYCKQDVKVTKDIYEYALKHGKVKYKEINETKEMALDTSKWGAIARRAVNYTLPF